MWYFPGLLIQVSPAQSVFYNISGYWRLLSVFFQFARRPRPNNWFWFFGLIYKNIAYSLEVSAKASSISSFAGNLIWAYWSLDGCFVYVFMFPYFCCTFNIKWICWFDIYLNLLATCNNKNITKLILYLCLPSGTIISSIFL